MIFTNESSPLRKNLEEIISLRDTSTHFITQEYELIYVPLFQRDSKELNVFLSDTCSNTEE